MAVCPQCGHALEEDFGVISCPQCQAVLFIDMEGLVHFHAPEHSPPENMLSDESEVTSEIQSESDDEPEVQDLDPEPVAGNDFSDVESFANSNLSLGPLTYSVIIEDINTKEIRAELKEALIDAKFQWDASELMRTISGGKLILKDLNPVKASVLIYRLRELKVKISWRQNVYN